MAHFRVNHQWPWGTAYCDVHITETTAGVFDIQVEDYGDNTAGFTATKDELYRFLTWAIEQIGSQS